MRLAPGHEIAEAIRGILEGFPGWRGVVLEDDNHADYRVRASVRGDRVEFLLSVNSKNIRHEVIPPAATGGKKRSLPVVFGQAWFPPKRAQALREQGVHYLDTAGNAFLDLPGLQVFRETLSTPMVDPVRKRPLGGVFNSSAVRVGLQLLLDPLLVESNLRHMAALAGVSAPSAKFALDAFKAEGYVIETGKRGRKFVDREGFLRRWAESYNQRYRPKHAMGRYARGASAISLAGLEACWGGEPAADRLTHNLEFAEQLIYSHSTKIGPLLAKNRLKPDSRGDVELVEACWGVDQQEPQGIAPAFVVYADLLNTRDPRCIEVAEQIFETILRDRLATDGD
jgi:hypothetical protein